MRLVVVHLVLLALSYQCCATLFEECGTEKHRVHYAETVVESPITDVVWATKHTAYVRTEANLVYRSADGGKEWYNITAQLQDSSEPQGTGLQSGVKSVKVSAEPHKVWFLGWGHQVWSTDGTNFHYRQTNNIVVDIIPHPTNSDWALVRANTPKCSDITIPGECHRDLWLTKDFGQTWLRIKKYIWDAAWGTAEKTIHFTRSAVENGRQWDQPWDQIILSRTTDLMETVDKSLRRTPAFLARSGFLYAASVTNPTAFVLSLYISGDDGETYRPMVFERSVEEHRYTILDNTENVTFVNVEQQRSIWGSTFVADNFESEFSLSLLRTKRTMLGKVDFARVQGLEGVYLANQYQREVSDHDPDTYLQTVASFDKGGVWKKLPKAVDSDCTEPDCSLHLFGNTVDEGTPLVSKASAIGLIIANGNEGQFMNTEPDEAKTYLSRDAGLTWHKIRDRPHVFQFGDHGGIVVMAKARDDTNRIIYSFNEGKEWKECNFTAEHLSMSVKELVVEPTATSSKFLVHGSRVDPVTHREQGVLIHLDFSSLHERQCEGVENPGTHGSDYEIWHASDGTGSGKCLLGKEMKFIRRKQDALCFNGEEFEREIFGHEVCHCTREDYECDGTCFIADDNGNCVNVCVGEPNDPQKRPADCQTMWWRTQGYVLVEGTQCTIEGGVDLRTQGKPCTDDGGHTQTPIVISETPLAHIPSGVPIDEPTHDPSPPETSSGMSSPMPSSQQKSPSPVTAPSPNVKAPSPHEPTKTTTETHHVETKTTGEGMGWFGIFAILAVVATGIAVVLLAGLFVLYRSNEDFRDRVDELLPETWKNSQGYGLVSGQGSGQFGVFDDGDNSLLDDDSYDNGDGGSGGGGVDLLSGGGGGGRITSLPPVASYDNDDVPAIDAPPS